MSTYSSVEFENLQPIPIRALEYRDMGPHTALNGASFPPIEEILTILPPPACLKIGMSSWVADQMA